MNMLGKNIVLKGITAKGKNRVREHGDRWTVLAETDHVLFAPSRPGHWLFVAPKGKGQNDKASRWVQSVGDENFTVSIDGG